jgi:signal transduction histidine kinase
MVVRVPLAAQEIVQKVEGDRHMSLTTRLVWQTLFLISVLWILDAAIDSFIFHEGSFTQQIAHPDSQEVYLRVVGIGFLLALGYSRFLFYKIKQAELEIQRAHSQLLALSRHLIQTQEQERRRIALELHDQLGQDLALLSIEIERLLQKAPKSQANQLQNLAIKNRAISTYVQTLSHQLHPSQLMHLGLVAASRSLCMEVSQASNMQIDFSHTDVPSPIPQDVSICFYRVLQESLTNIVKHGEVQAARVELAGRPDKLQLQVYDAGVGFDPESAGNNGGLGFVGMQERLNLVGGELLIESQTSVGTQIKASAPLNSSPSPD